MLFSGYSCSADPFARYRAGQSVAVCWDLGKSLLAPLTNFTKSKQFTSKFLKNGPKTSQNNFGWLYRARAVLSMLLSGYSCSADSFARYLAGQFSPVFLKLYKYFTNFTKSKSTKAGPSRSVLLAAPKELCLFVCGRKRAFDVI